MRKSFNTMNGGYEQALANLRRHGIRLYVTFILGYDDDNGDTLRGDAGLRRAPQVLHRGLQSPDAVSRARRCTSGSKSEGRLLYDRWWLDPAYRYGMVPFAPRGMTAERGEAALHRGAPAVLQPRVDLPAQPRLRGQRRGTGSCGATSSPSTCCSAPKCCSASDFPLGDEAYPAPLLKARARARSGCSSTRRLCHETSSVDLAAPADDAGIRGLLRRQPVPGRISLAYEREPDFSLGCAVTGENAAIVVAALVDDGAIVGVACRSVRHVFVNGRRAADRLPRPVAHRRAIPRPMAGVARVLAARADRSRRSRAGLPGVHRRWK